MFCTPHCFYLTVSSASFESNVRQQTPATITMLSNRSSSQLLCHNIRSSERPLASLRSLSFSLCFRRSVGHFHFLQFTMVVQNPFNPFTASRCTNTLLFYAASTSYSTLQPSLHCTFHARRLLDEYPIFAFSRTYASLSAPRALFLTCSFIQSLSLSLILPYHIATLP